MSWSRGPRKVSETHVMLTGDKRQLDCPYKITMPEMSLRGIEVIFSCPVCTQSIGFIVICEQDQSRRSPFVIPQGVTALGSGSSFLHILDRDGQGVVNRASVSFRRLPVRLQVYSICGRLVDLRMRAIRFCLKLRHFNSYLIAQSTTVCVSLPDNIRSER